MAQFAPEYTILRIMSLDLGAKRVGVALSDELYLTATGHAVLDRQPHAEFLAKLKRLIEENSVNRIVIGLPKRMDGTMGPEAQRAMSMVQEIKKHLGVEVATWDERLSTAAVERVLIEADLSRQKRKQVVDKAAATYILQGYLDFLRSSAGRADHDGQA